MKKIFTILLLGTSMILSGCDSEPEKYVIKCLESHDEVHTTMIPSGKSFVPMNYTQTVCDKYSKEPELNPRWVEWNNKKLKR